MTGLVGWWPLHENTGGTAYDLSGNENHGSLNGGVIQGVAGKSGLTAYNLQGDGYVSTSSQVLPDDSTKSFSISAWIRPSSDTGTVVRQQEGSGDYAGITFQLDSGSDLVEFYITDGSNSILVGAGSISSNTWHHVAISYDGSKSVDGINVFVDGKRKSPSNTIEENINDSIGSTVDTTIGARPEDNSAYLTGTIADVRIYDRSLSPQEIQTLYEWGSSDYTDRSYHNGSHSGAVSRWKFDDSNSDSSTAADSWASNNGTVVNSANFVSDSIRGKAISFDGSNYVDLGSPVFPSGAKTLAAWFKYEGGGLASGDAYLFEQEDSTGDIQSFYYNDDTEIIFLNSGSTEVQYSKTITPDIWNFVAYAYDGSKSRLYFNGSLVDEGGGSDTDNANNTGLGTKRLGGGLWKGKMDDARIYNRALDPHEVFQLYQWGTRGRDMRKLTVNKR